jgi:hypothetical protein
VISLLVIWILNLRRTYIAMDILKIRLGQLVIDLIQALEMVSHSTEMVEVVTYLIQKKAVKY